MKLVSLTVRDTTLHPMVADILLSLLYLVNTKIRLICRTGLIVLAKKEQTRLKCKPETVAPPSILSVKIIF